MGWWQLIRGSKENCIVWEWRKLDVQETGQRWKTGNHRRVLQCSPVVASFSTLPCLLWAQLFYGQNVPTGQANALVFGSSCLRVRFIVDAVAPDSSNDVHELSNLTSKDPANSYEELAICSFSSLVRKKLNRTEGTEATEQWSNPVFCLFLVLLEKWSPFLCVSVVSRPRCYIQVLLGRC